MKFIKILTLSLVIVGLSLVVTPKPANAFTLFGIHFFEKSKPSPTPTPTPTPVPSVTPTLVATPTPVKPVVQNGDNLPSTGPQENVAMLLGVIVTGFIARKYWQISHQA